MPEKYPKETWRKIKHLDSITQKKHVKICPVCNEKFFVVDKRKIYCSVECRMIKIRFARSKRKTCPYPLYTPKCESLYMIRGRPYCKFEGKCVVL